jgi:glycosyltransferase involved in cell wall biosynthesis
VPPSFGLSGVSSLSPLVSVCLPVYNGEKFIAEAIESVLAQSYTNFELIVLDDGSSDRSAEIIQSYADKDDRIKFETNVKNLGLFGNYNECIRRSKGEFIKLFAQDDLFHPDAFEKMANVLQNNPDVALVTTAREWVDDKGEPVEAISKFEARVKRPFTESIKVPGRKVARDSFSDLLNWLGEPVTMMYRKDDAGTGFDARFFQLGDLEYWYRILAHGAYYFIDEELTTFRRHSNQTTVKNHASLTSLLEWLLLASKNRELVREIWETDDDFTQLYTRRFINAIHSRFYAKDGLVSVQKNKIVELLTDYDSVIAAFEPDHETPRNVTNEYRAFAITAIREAARLRQEYLMVKHVVRTQRKVLVEKEEEYEAKIASLEGEVAELRAALSELGNSLSWKVTAPLRGVKRLLP